MPQKSFVLWMCLGQMGNLLPHVVVPAVMTAHLIPQWGLSNTEAGILAAAYAAGYMLAVPVLSALTDRLNPGDASRSVTYYTSSFSFGVGLSFLLSQWIADSFGWRWAFLLTGLGPLLMLFCAWRMQPKPPPPPSGALLDFRPVIRNRPAMAFILAYGAHCFELYGIRTWIVAFWTFVIERHARGDGFEALTASWATPMMISVIFTVLAMPASIAGNELSIRLGRHRAIRGIQFASAAIALLIGLNTDGSILLLLPLILIYALTVPGRQRSSCWRYQFCLDLWCCGSFVDRFAS